MACIRVDRCNAISCGVGQSGAADTGWRVAFPCQLTASPYSMDRGRRAGMRAGQSGQVATAEVQVVEVAVVQAAQLAQGQVIPDLFPDPGAELLPEPHVALRIGQRRDQDGGIDQLRIHRRLHPSTTPPPAGRHRTYMVPYAGTASADVALQQPTLPREPRVATHHLYCSLTIV